ncbi:hypothetical protein ABL78_4451 [Leptomonas seymouri]|uniref:Uncharacterized protein n=1 Tax=Leptomonas seymouri TaxID=5684 RepID=A0A0N0P5W5_LEPSE|nr:hypothetical protein ABL78_4451 [Leptomonas seymouri]|eukprot:KPI86467.1 hypothetical protein ABL78_4451 [Leptomonas seymouri]
MRRVAVSSLNAQCVRAICGAAPVMYFPPSASAAVSKEEQVKRNTKIAIEMVKRYKGEIPAPYARKYTATVEELEKEIEALLGHAASMRKAMTDDQPMDKLGLMERCLRHALWSYHKDEGKCDFNEIAKWIVYTPDDEIKFAQMKRHMEAKTKLAAFRATRAEQGLPDAPVPQINWSEEYKNVVDRELVNEKRVRYDTIAVNTMDRDEAQIDAVLQQYRKPVQDKRLDDLVELLERFKPVLAREAIMQRLTIKHLEGQLGVWRYMDWCPEVRDRAELEVDVSGFQWWSPLEERRLLPVRLRSVNEVREIMTQTQSSKEAEMSKSNPQASQSGGDGDRERLLKEVLALQARIHQRDDAPVEEKAGH